ncbi:hypothetical protein [Limnothrix sp. FACHB-881]|nr:hypothetical protein [Limnothrix sp. FACHB-881]
MNGGCDRRDRTLFLVSCGTCVQVIGPIGAGVFGHSQKVVLVYP